MTFGTLNMHTDLRTHDHAGATLLYGLGGADGAHTVQIPQGTARTIGALNMHTDAIPAAAPAPYVLLDPDVQQDGDTVTLSGNATHNGLVGTLTLTITGAARAALAANHSSAKHHAADRSAADRSAEKSDQPRAGL